MKLLTFLFAFIPYLTFAQIYVEDHNINADENIHFCHVLTDCGFRNTTTVFFDYGQKVKRYRRENKVYDYERVEVKFNGIVDVMNFMKSNGWEVMEEEFTLNTDGSGACLFKKKKQ